MQNGWKDIDFKVNAFTREVVRPIAGKTDEISIHNAIGNSQVYLGAT